MNHSQPSSSRVTPDQESRSAWSCSGAHQQWSDARHPRSSETPPSNPPPPQQRKSPTMQESPTGLYPREGQAPSYRGQRGRLQRRNVSAHTGQQPPSRKRSRKALPIRAEPQEEVPDPHRVSVWSCGFRTQETILDPGLRGQQSAEDEPA